MNICSRILMAGAALLIIGVFFLPIWSIKLEAPQFPEGLKMCIYVNKIGGSSENILQNVNILNHYIGMKKIEPNSIPELKIIPVVLIGFLVLGLLAAVLGNRALMMTWIALLILAGIIGIYDFYTWLYDYGHNLDPRAPIKVPGMAYQPPLFGSKWLLNFRSVSYPASGTILLGISVLLALGGILYDRVKRKKQNE
ncbi:MAG: hypothetical protein KatS3mg031_0906 [Chitinophagales bacterium]|nr:MAG: hypothetical protein KatS3mg031_0906 [Chitinophagales bacterium]